MIVPVYIHHYELEKICESDGEYAVCDNYYADHEYTIDDVEFDYGDLEGIVDRYLDDILEILQKNYKKKLNMLLKTNR
ncbi:hypothetical protein [Saccharolobus islandicus]|uniref:Uncharacterized protein n=1 Tax=Saccharolobus islandicus (strain M.16.4 / Kamchatka \|nr:hypothetical protein [Sulfolobus islandicus]ACR40785.1 hypothetical protein M164_0151 [Sulfolobus islandicus M.16.4]